MLEIMATTGDLEGQIGSLSVRVVGVATALMLVFTVLATIHKKKAPRSKVAKRRQQAWKLFLFSSMVITLIASTLFLFGSTVYLNTKADSGGPVHWHTDIEFWACGQELELRDPTGFLSNKIGTATYHEHNDKRIHLEGVVVKRADDSSLDKFMRVTDGYIRDNSLAVALNDDEDEWLATEDHRDGDNQAQADVERLRPFVRGDEGERTAVFRNGQRCGNEAAEVQAFLFRFDDKTDTYRQTKLADPAAYTMRDESVVPPGDCVIVEFDQRKDRTNKLCEQYGVRDKSRCTEYGVETYTPKLCNIRQVTTGGSE